MPPKKKKGKKGAAAAKSPPPTIQEDPPSIKGSVRGSQLDVLSVAQSNAGKSVTSKKPEEKKSRLKEKAGDKSALKRK